MMEVSVTLSTPRLPRRLEQRQGPDHIRLHKGCRPQNGSVYVRFCRKVDNSIYLMLLHKPVDQLCIANIPLNEGMLLRVGEIFEIL